MERIKEGEFTHVLVWKIDRVSRNLMDFATMYAQCKKLGVTFVSKMQIFDELKARGVKDVGFICMDGVSGLEEGAKSIFPQVVVQRCIVHLIRNSIKYIPSKDYKAYTTQLRKVYGAVNLDRKSVV